MMAAIRRVPVVVVLGATGTGKSKLAIEIGQRFNGEIISADSMQLYKSLDIITNKVTAEEQAQCPHHLLSVLNPLNKNNTVVDFKNMALPIVERLLEERKTPIIVGGTNYYIEALLWNFLIDKQTADIALQAGKNRPPQQSDSINQPATTSTTNAQPTIASPENQDLRVKDDSVSTQCRKETTAPVETDSNMPDSSASVLYDKNDCDSDSDAKANEGLETYEKTSNKTNESLHTSEKTSDKMNELLETYEKTNDKTNESSETCEKTKSKAREEKEGQYAKFDSTYLHSLLQKVDPESAKLLHPQNRRKVVRALQVYDSYGVPMSRIHEAQHKEGNTPGLSGALRYPHCCVFWLQSEQNVLEERLDKRVDDMLNNGLMSELHSLHSEYLQSVAAQNGVPDYTFGIFQSIGFKEFHQYLILPADKRETPEGKALFEKGVEDLKTATRQYARRQIKWIKNRFIRRAGIHVPAVYSLDSTDPSQWTTNVFEPAVNVLSAVMDGRDVPVKPLSADEVPGVIHVHNVCHVCDGRVFTTLQEWEAHLGSRKHKRKLGYKRYKERVGEHGLKRPESAEKGRSRQEREHTTDNSSEQNGRGEMTTLDGNTIKENNPGIKQNDISPNSKPQASPCHQSETAKRRLSRDDSSSAETRQKQTKSDS